MRMMEGSSWSKLTEAQQRIVDKDLSELTLSGVALEGAERERFNEIKKELSKQQCAGCHQGLQEADHTKSACGWPARVCAGIGCTASQGCRA
ncbi:hypothetical protein WJX74_010007 [Apatococcus lobatus]|uniref:Oligopeptidase A N-terminal domain-containing protein n=1 Tax=Apatococcus lobatus TaxID=904363 RepID=A0AAW1RZ89_9CHLO